MLRYTQLGKLFTKAQCVRPCSTIPLGYKFVKTPRSNLKIGDIVGIKHTKLYKLTSEQHRSSGYEGYGESWNVYEAKELDATLNIKPNGNKIDILQGFNGECGDAEFNKLVQHK